MSTMSISELYELHIKPLPTLNQLRLVEFITHNLVKYGMADDASASPKHDIMELRGLGADIWKGIDAQEYVHNLREEWQQET